MRDKLFLDLVRGTAPLMVWALHFTVCYVLVAAQCSPALAGPQAPSRSLLLGLTLAALAACALLLWKGWPADTGKARLLDWARAGSAVLGACAVAWTGVVLLLLDGCG